MKTQKLKIEKKNVAKLDDSALDQIQGGKAAAGDLCVFKSSSCTYKDEETIA